jgi:hypothetical protein
MIYIRKGFSCQEKEEHFLLMQPISANLYSPTNFLPNYIYNSWEANTLFCLPLTHNLPWTSFLALTSDDFNSLFGFYLKHHALHYSQ